jgi:glutaminase
VASGSCGERRIALDLTAVHSLDDVARRMLLEVVRRLSLEGRMVYLVDPAAVIPDPDPGEGGQLTVVTSAKDLTGG